MVWRGQQLFRRWESETCKLFLISVFNQYRIKFNFMKKRFRHVRSLIVSVLFSIFCLPALCQVYIKGTVKQVDNNRKTPLSGVSVGIKNSGEKTATSNNGRFSLQITRNDISKKLIVSAAGFRNMEVTIHDENEWTNTIGNIEISYQIVVLGKKKSKPQPESPPPPPGRRRKRSAVRW